MRLYLVRHPQPDIASGICYGRTNVAVSPQLQTLALSKLIATLPKQLPVFSSPLSRCAQLAARLAEVLDSGVPVYDPRLMEMDFGNWEMRAWNDIPRAEVDAWAKDLAVYRPGGGENVMEVAQRVRAFHDDLLQLNRDDAIVICHAGSIRMLLACQHVLPLVEMALYAARTPHQIAYGELIVVYS